MIKAVIFDMDGVIIDSEPIYYKRTIEFLEDKKFLFDDEALLKIVGASNKETMKMLAEIIGDEFDSSFFVDEYEKYFGERPIDYKELLFPEIELLLRDLRAKGYLLALVSSSGPENIQTVLEQTGLKDYFSVILSGHDFKESKPNPEIYLTCAKILGVKPDECMALEDSHYGIASAKDAGMKVVARKDERFAFDQRRADYIFTDLRNIKTILREDRGDIDIPIRKIRLKSKEYIKGLFIRNSEHRTVTGKSAFKIDPETEKEFIHLGYFNKDNLEAVLIYEENEENFEVHQFAVSNISFDDGPNDLIMSLEEEAKKLNKAEISVKSFGRESKYLEKEGYTKKENVGNPYDLYIKELS